MLEYDIGYVHCQLPHSSLWVPLASKQGWPLHTAGERPVLFLRRGAKIPPTQRARIARPTTMRSGTTV